MADPQWLRGGYVLLGTGKSRHIRQILTQKVLNGFPVPSPLR